MTQIFTEVEQKSVSICDVYDSIVKSLQTHRRDAEFCRGSLLWFSAKLRALCVSAVQLTFLQ